MYKRFEPSEQVFVDREEYLDWMSDALLRCKEKAVVLQLSGIGGIGKSALLDYWNRTIETTIRLDCRQHADFYSRLNVLAKGAVLLGLRLPRFDVLWQIRLRFVEGLEPVKEEGREWAKEVLVAIPFIGSLASIGGAIGAISAKVAPKLKSRYGELAAWLQDRLGKNHIESLLEILWKAPRHAQFLFMDALAEDLNSRSESDRALLFLLDHFEHVDDASKDWKYGGKKISEAELWCVFLSQVRNSVGVLATRLAISTALRDDVSLEQHELTELDEKSSVELLHERSVNDGDLQRRIVSVSGGNPFVIDAICDMLETERVSLEDVDCLQADTLGEVRLRTWRRLFDHVEGLHEPVNHAGLLPHFTKSVMTIVSPSLTSDQWDRLRRLSFVREQSDGTYVLHELAKELVLSELGPRLKDAVEDVADSLETASKERSDLSLLGMAFSAYSLASGEIAIARLREAVDELIESHLADDAHHLLASTVLSDGMGRCVIQGLRGKALFLSSRYAEAEVELQSAIEHLRGLGTEMTTAQRDFLADCLSQYGRMLLEVPDQEGAQKSFKEAIAIRRELADEEPDKYGLGLAWSLIVRAQSMLNRWPDEAEKHALESLNILSGIDDPGSKSLLRAKSISFSVLALVRTNLFRWSEADEPNQRSLEIQRQLLEMAPDAPREISAYARLLNNVGALQEFRGHELETRNLFEQALKLRRAAVELQPQTYRPSQAITLQNVAFFYLRTLRQPQMAETYFRESLVTIRDQLGYYYSYARDLLEDQERFRDSLAALELMPKEVPGHWAGQIGYALSGLAYACLEQGRTQEALDLVAKAVSIRRDLMRHLDWGLGFGLSLNVAGIIYSSAGEVSRGEESLIEAIEVLQETRIDMADTQLYLASSLNNCGVLLLQTGRLGEAIERLTEAVRVLRDYMVRAPELHPGWVAEILTNLAVAQKQKGGFDEAEPLLREALDLESRLIDIAPESYLYYREHTLRVYSSLLRLRGDEEGAETHLKESLRLFERFSDLGMTPSPVDAENEARFLLIY